MNNFFKLALLSAAVLAKKNKKNKKKSRRHYDSDDFVGFAAKYNKHYNCVGEMTSRLENFKKN